MKVESLGHVVLKVSDIEQSEHFYSGVLGMPVCARLAEKGMKMTFFSLGNHHDLAVAEVSAEEAAAGDQAVGLHHVAFCVGNSLDQLVDAKAHLAAAGVKSNPVDHEVTKSIYFSDPDGNQVELYVDASDAWRTEPQRVAQAQPLDI